MRSAATAVMVVLMVLRTAAQEEAPIDTTTETTIETTCAWVTCGPNCGYITRSDGCPDCDCHPTCENTECGENQECIMQEVRCFAPPCFAQPFCVLLEETTTTIETTTAPCSAVTCGPNCGYITRSDGCPDCDCHPTCEHIECGENQECVMQDVQCFAAPCFAQPTCVPLQETTTSCPTFKCGPDCVPDTGSDGCPTCACPPSCQTVRCRAGYECQLVKATCFKYPCFPEAKCVPTKKYPKERLV